jgi:hypothetical protein
LLLHPAGEFQEVVDVKLRHTHPRVQKQRAAAANLAAATAAATAAASVAASLEEDAEGTEAVQAAPAAAASSEGQQPAEPTSIMAAAAAAAASSGAQGIQVVQVLPWADAASPDSSSSSSQGELLLELDNVSINTPDGGLALVQNLSLKVSRGSSCLGMVILFCQTSTLGILAPPLLQAGRRPPFKAHALICFVVARHLSHDNHCHLLTTRKHNARIAL